ncbi:MAG: 4-(cytidine 5'-diphospho)-2-C-methyl-D-erythritol kinase [Candidatus Methylacidiphilales bacterium]|nr:4-(cytidine 5'-diphospho)-2-C-methyl-D-erythritol kinase [Candidatus Methylacidiphilales bacterium]
MLLKVRSPAKINLTLEITGKRPDGFHELETLMCPVGLYDELEIEESGEGITLRVEGADLPADPTNLVWRAAALVQEVTGCRKGVRMVLRKVIPMGGGLAGGSGNAAAVLHAVNDLWGCGLSRAQLKDLAGRLGSDIAFFLDGGASWCTGRGEITRPVELDWRGHVLLLNPGFGVPTPWAYRTYAAEPQAGELGRLELAVRGIPGRERVRLRNDLEPAVFTKYFWIAEAKAWLLGQPGVVDAMMSGSGATVFALLPDAEAASRVAEAARDHFGPNCWIQTPCLLP